MNNKDPKQYKKANHYNLFQSFSFALQGIWFALRWERNLRIHLLVAGFVTYFSHRYYALSKAEKAVLILAMVLIPTMELLNTALEKIVDLESPDYHFLAKIAKDVAAGAVLVCSFGTVLIGIVLFWDIPTLQKILADMLEYWYVWILLLGGSLALVFLPEKQPRPKP